MPVFAHSLEVRTEAISLLRAGISNTEVSRKFNVSKGTIGYWKHLDRQQSGTLPGRSPSICSRCNPDELPLDHKSYSYLLGLYLGDGCIYSSTELRKKGVFVLGIACADAWPGLMDECESAIRAVMPHNKVNRRKYVGMHEVKAYSKHWPCLFPQHGPGRKHKRAIVLEPWQQEIVDELPEEFIRGLIHSDGCRVLNSAVRTRGGKTTRYFYSRYQFSNESPHIRDLFTDTLDALGIEWRYSRYNCISISKRQSVRQLDEFVGPKH
jgi:hypothetical protein